MRELRQVGGGERNGSRRRNRKVKGGGGRGERMVNGEG